MTASTTDVDGSVQSHMIVFNLTVVNVNDLMIPLSRPLPGRVNSTRDGRLDITRIGLGFNEGDVLIPGTSAEDFDFTVFDSNFKLAFTIDGGRTTGECEFPRARRPIEATTTSSNFGGRGGTTSQLRFRLQRLLNLADCLSDDLPAGIGDMYALSQASTLILLGLTVDDYAEFAGPADQTHPLVFSPNVGVGFGYTIPNLRTDLVGLAGGNYSLDDDRTLISWMPISGFNGTLEGNNHTITFTGGATGPLFDTIGSNGTVQNLGVINTTLANRNDGRIFNVYATGDSSCTGNFCKTGGLIGENRGTISHSYATGDSSCPNDSCRTGGLVGENHGTISHSYATGNSSCTISNCLTGGLVGENRGTLSNSYAIGKSTCLGSQCESGGLVGSNLGPITASYAIGTVLCSTSTNFCTIGGLVGENSGGRIIDSYATGNRTCDISSINIGCRTGGLFGLGQATSTVTNAYTIGEGMCGGSSCDTGGLIGVLFPGTSLTVISSYRAENVGMHGTLRTLAQLRCPTMANQTCAMGTNTYEGWNGTIWDFGTADDLPTLRDLPDCPTFRPNCRH